MAMPSRSPARSTAPMLGPLPDIAAARARLRDIIHRRSFGYGEIKLASGRVSNFYFNLKPTMLDAEGAALLAPAHARCARGRTDRRDRRPRDGRGADRRRGGAAEPHDRRADPGLLRAQEAEGARRAAVDRGPDAGRDAGRQAHRRRRGCHHHGRLGHEGGRGLARGRRRDRLRALAWSIARRAPPKLSRRRASISAPSTARRNSSTG